MFRLSVILISAAVVVFAAIPSGHAYVAARGNIETFGPGGACMPQGCAPISMSPYPNAMPSRISKCKAPPACAPEPCMPPPCGPMPCYPMKAPVVWY